MRRVLVCSLGLVMGCVGCGDDGVLQQPACIADGVCEVACSLDPDCGGVGGTSAMGGTTGQGGTPVGGVVGSGGTVATGGQVVGTGGALEATGGMVATGGTQPSEDGPRILSVGTNTTTLTAGESLVISVVGTDPDGIDDLIGGTVTDGETGATYGALASSAAEGSYSLTLSWNDLNVAHQMDTGPGGTTRTFQVTLHDVSGNAATDTVVINLVCDSEEDAICDGRCVNLDSNEYHCSVCHNACPDNGSYCNEGVCRWTETDYDSEGGLTCSQVCNEAGGTCRVSESGVAGDASYYASYYCSEHVGLATCDTLPPDPSVVPQETCSNSVSNLREVDCYCYVP